MKYLLLLLLIVSLSNAQAEECLASDINRDGTVDFADFTLFAGSFGKQSVGCASESCGGLRDSVQALMASVEALETRLTLFGALFDAFQKSLTESATRDSLRLNTLEAI